jgi:hypothetical protein
MEDPVLTYFDCSLCGRPFHISAAHRDAVEAHHRKLAHAGDMAAVLREQEPVCSGCINQRGFIIADLNCAVHGLNGTDPGDGPR